MTDSLYNFHNRKVSGNFGMDDKQRRDVIYRDGFRKLFTP